MRIKNILVNVLIVLVIFSTFPLIACSSVPKYKKFDSFPEYNNFAEGVVAIDVHWGDDGRWIEFTIDDTEQVNTLVNMFSETTMKNLGKGKWVGDNHYIELKYANGLKNSVNLQYYPYNGYGYFYPDSTIRNYIEQIGKDMKVIP